jgi:hypothetical protein
MNCNTCNYFFSDNDSFNIHLKTCRDNINDDPKNKYYCPSCDKKFRVFTNLERHNESKKHLNLFEWNKKQLNSNNNQLNIKTINLISNIEEKESKPKHQSEKDSFLEKLVRDRELELQTYKIPPQLPPQPKINLDIQSINFNKNKNNENENEKNNINDHLNLLVEDDDIDLSEELKKTEMRLNLSVELHQKEIEKVENNQNQNNDDDFLNDIQEQRNITNIIKEQIKHDEQILQSQPSVKFQPQPKPQVKFQPQQQPKPQVKFQPKPTPQVIKQPETAIKLEPSKLKYPIEFLQNPIWKSISKLVNDTKKEDEVKLVNNIMITLSNSPLSIYLHICAYIIYSEELDNRIELRKRFINGLIEVQKAFAKLIALKKLIWNGKNVVEGYAFMNKLKLKEKLDLLQ